MKIPANPPDWIAHLESLAGDPHKLLRLVKEREPTIKGRYVHWKRLRRMPAPSGLSNVDWWASVKLARSPMFRPLPMTDSKGRPFLFAQTEAMHEWLHNLDRAAGLGVLSSDPAVTPDLRRQYGIRSIMEEAITSSQIEGASTTRQVAKEMLQTGRSPRDRSERMILNNYRAMKRLTEVARSPLNVEVILELHEILGRDALDKPDGAGRFRRDDEDVRVVDADGQILHEPPHASELEERMARLCAFANGATPDCFVHPVVRAIALHFWLAYDHPFIDGNGRCARALFYWSMLRSNYWVAEYISISSEIRKAHTQYGKAFLYVETDELDLTYFLLYHLDLIRKSIEGVQLHLKEITGEVGRVEALIKTKHAVNPRQSAVLAHALRNPKAAYTIEAHRVNHGVVYQTARTDLLGLESLGFLVRATEGKEFVFRVAPDLMERLKG